MSTRNQLTTVALGLLLVGTPVRGEAGLEGLLDEARNAFVAGQLPQAKEILERAPKDLRWHPQVLVFTGRVLARMGDSDSALLHWQAAHSLGPEGEAKRLLETADPSLVSKKVVLRTGDEFVELARWLVDFRRQREVEQAWKLLIIPRGLKGKMRMKEADSLQVISELHEVGLLARPGGPPSGRGHYITDDEGNVRSTVFGTPGALKDPPPALASKTGFVVLPKVIREALPLGGPEVVEVGVALLSGPELADSAGLLSRAISQTKDPWAFDAVVDRLESLVVSGSFPLPAGLEPGLRRILEHGERGQRWKARGILYGSGVKDLPAVPANELAQLADEHRKVPVTRAAQASGFASLPPGEADKLMSAWIRAAQGERAVTALESAMDVGGKETALAVIEAHAAPTGVWKDEPRLLQELLLEWAGGDQGAKPGGWKRWWTRKFGR